MKLGHLIFTAAFLLFGSIQAQSPDEAIVLDPDGTYIDIILHRMDQSGPYAGRSFDPADENPEDAGYVFYESRTYGAERWDTYVTPDALNMLAAFDNGGMIILNPGTYYFSVRSSVYEDSVWQYTSMNWRNFDSGINDLVLRGSESDSTGPLAKVVTDQFLHIGADPLWMDYFSSPNLWDEVRTVNQMFENIWFDNQEYIEFLELSPERPSTLIGQLGKANVTFTECKFTGGGAVFHTVGSVTIQNNSFENTVYGAAVTSNYFWSGLPASAHVSIRDNEILSSGIGVRVSSNGQLGELYSESKVVEITENDIDVLGLDAVGVWLDNNVGGETVLQNNIELTSDQGIGIFAVLSKSALISKNFIDNGFRRDYSGITILGNDSTNVIANEIVGSFDHPLLVDLDWFVGTNTTAQYNIIERNKLKYARALIGGHISLLGGTYKNVVKSSGVNNGNIIVLDYGVQNYVNDPNFKKDPDF